MTGNLTTTLLPSNNATVLETERDRFAGPPLDWGRAKAQWGVAWQIHIYCLGSLFGVLALWALVHLIRVCLRKDLPSRAYYITMELLVVIAGTGRAFYLLFDVYATRPILPKIIGQLSKFVNFPSITSGFILLFAVLMRLTKMQVASHRLFRPLALFSIVTFNYIFGMAADFLAVNLINGYVFFFVCDSYFVLWGIISSAAYIYIFHRLYVRVVVNRRMLNDIASEATEMGQNKAEQKKNLDTKMPVAAKITLVSAISFFLIGALNIYRMGVLLVNYSKNKLENENPWYWWSYNTFMRLFELAMCATIAFVGSLPFYNK